MKSVNHKKQIKMRKTILILALGLILSSQIIFGQAPSYVPTNGLVGYWPFNGNANDMSGNGNNGIVNGATLTTDRFGNVDSAYSFDGINDFVSVPNIASNGNDSRTFSVWANLTNISNSGLSNYFISTGSASQSSTFNFRLYNGKLNIMGFENDPVATNASLTNSIWYLCTVTYDGTNIKFYVNGILLDTVAPFSPFTTFGQNNFFGKSNHIGWEYFLQGKIDDIGIWNRALTQQEITNLYNSVSSSECLTMIINTGTLNTNPITYTSTVNIYPNPANDQITIDCGNLANVIGWSIKITNTLGQEVFSAPMNTQQYVVPLNTWSGQGMYFVKIINAQNQVVNIKKIILQ
jgi:hypothetical protein